MIRIGVIGLGHWGPNLVRCLDSIEDSEVVAVCDRDETRLKSVSQRVPDALKFHDASDVLDPLLVDAVVIATPTMTHFPLARKAIEQGLHVFVEKPLATSVDECRQLIQLAERHHVTLFVGHVFLYSAAVAKLKKLVNDGDLGDICYIASSRLNLGPVRQDVNALWDLAPHDVSIMLDLIGELPTEVSCSGLAYLNGEVHDVCSLTLHFHNEQLGIVHVSWLDPRKKREMTVVGSRKMAVYDDLEPLEKVKIYDIGVEVPQDTDSFGEYQFTFRYGDTYSPRLIQTEPLKAECRNFIESVIEGSKPWTDGYNGVDVVSVIEAAERSLNNGGGRMKVTKVMQPAVHHLPLTTNNDALSLTTK